ncbi:hypothetical protein D3C75_326730 [compost metagenome]
MPCPMRQPTCAGRSNERPGFQHGTATDRGHRRRSDGGDHRRRTQRRRLVADGRRTGRGRGRHLHGGAGTRADLPGPDRAALSRAGPGPDGAQLPGATWRGFYPLDRSRHRGVHGYLGGGPCAVDPGGGRPGQRSDGPGATGAYLPGASLARWRDAAGRTCRGRLRPDTSGGAATGGNPGGHSQRGRRTGPWCRVA